MNNIYTAVAQDQFVSKKNMTFPVREGITGFFVVLEDGAISPLNKEDFEATGHSLEECLAMAKENEEIQMHELGAFLNECNPGIIPDESTSETARPTLYIAARKYRGIDAFGTPLGAGVIVHPDVLAEAILEAIGEGKYYIIPSSVHELLVMSNVEGIPADELVDIIKGVNESQVAPHERLSDNLFEITVKAGEKSELKVVEIEKEEAEEK